MEVRKASQLADLFPGFGTHLLALHDEWLLARGVEIVLVSPVQCEGPLLVAEPVADEVLVASIDQDVDACLEHGWDQLVVIPHEVNHEGLVQDQVATLEAHVDFMRNYH